MTSAPEPNIIKNAPEYHKYEEYQNRLKKLKDLQNLNLDPYPHQFTQSNFIEHLKGKYNENPIGNSEEASEGKTENVCIAGRLTLFRAMGKNAFAQVTDESGTMQIMFNRDLSKVTGYDPEKAGSSPAIQTAPMSHIKFIGKMIDLGDIIGIEGNLFRTQKGEITIFAKKVTILCKSLLPLPDKHSGLADKELRYRKRWLDLIANQDVKNVFKVRSQILKIIRDYFEAADFMEVETPVLQNIYGGAEARPFTTEQHAHGQEMFLRISIEIALKKLLVGGMGRIFEIGKVFRNEGIDRNHNPEFTLLEAYAPYWDYNDLMTFAENLVEKLALDLLGKTQVPFYKKDEGKEILIDLKTPWKRLTVKGALLELANIDVDKMSDQEMRDILLKMETVDPKKVNSVSRGLLITMLFEEKAQPLLIQPHHITDHPIETTPLCKPHRDPKERENGIVERFESFLLGEELWNAYTELNDPEIQRKLLEDQAAKKAAGDEEANPLDEEFIEAICQGMPPSAGIGIGIDRLVMLFTNSQSIRDVLYFPIMKISPD